MKLFVDGKPIEGKEVKAVWEDRNVDTGEEQYPHAALHVTVRETGVQCELIHQDKPVRQDELVVLDIMTQLMDVPG